MGKLFWAYFLSDNELVDLYLSHGGSLGDGNEPEDLHVINHSKHALLATILPGNIELWDGLLDNEIRAIYIVGDSGFELEYAMLTDMRMRCRKLFGRDPDRCTWIDTAVGQSQLQRNGKIHSLQFINLLAYVSICNLACHTR
jgi:hypothetical protein